MGILLRLVDSALLAAACALGALLLQGQGHADASVAPLVAGLVGAGIVWLAG